MLQIKVVEQNFNVSLKLFKKKNKNSEESKIKNYIIHTTGLIYIYFFLIEKDNYLHSLKSYICKCVYIKYLFMFSYCYDPGFILKAYI